MTTFEEYRCQEGDTVDMIAFSRFGAHGMEAEILAANPGLADLAPFLPLGHVVRIPITEVKKTVVTTGRLWD
jgi:phage tail protein X